MCRVILGLGFRGLGVLGFWGLGFRGSGFRVCRASERGRVPSSPSTIRVPCLLLFGFNKGTRAKGYDWATQLAFQLSRLT